MNAEPVTSAVAHLQTLQPKSTIFYRVPPEPRIYKQQIIEVSPGKRCILVEDQNTKKPLWLQATSIEIIEVNPPEPSTGLGSSLYQTGLAPHRVSG